jgi:hypothetical protein
MLGRVLERCTPRRCLRMLGWPGVVAIGVLVMLPMFHLSAIRPAQLRLEELQQRTVAWPTAPLDGREQTLPLAGQLAAFYRAFPAADTSPLWLEKLFAAAAREGLRLDQAEYKVVPAPAGRLLRYHITLPVTGEYRKIRAFLRGLPAEVPTIALEQLQFERQQIGDGLVEAKLRLVLYLVKEPG